MSDSQHKVYPENLEVVDFEIIKTTNNNIPKMISDHFGEEFLNQ